MSTRQSAARVLAPLFATLVALAAILAVSATSLPSADAASPKVKILTKGPYKKNQTIKVKVTGFPAGAQVAVGVCPAKRDPNGPGDCGPSSRGYSRLLVANKKGAVKTTLRVPKGKLMNVGKTPFKCSNKKKQRCSVHASTISAPSIWKETKRLKYA